MSIEQANFTYSQKSELVDYVNVYRAKHNSPPMEWDDTISSFAQDYSFFLAANSLFQHSTKEGYGENLAYFQGYPNDMMTLIKKSIDLWYDEIKLYNFNYPGYSPSTGHFTCLVWKSSTKFGMGYSYNSTTKIVDVTMNTAPPGNIIGQFQTNVEPPVSDIPQPTPIPYPTPTPIPYPTPTPTPIPYPEPEPEPEPLPEPSPSYDEINTIKRVIYSLYTLINMINMKRPARTSLYALDQIISELRLLDDSIIPNKTYLLNRLFYVRYSLQTGRSYRLIGYALSEVARALSSLV